MNRNDYIMSSPGISVTRSLESVFTEGGLPYPMTDEDCRVVDEGENGGEEERKSIQLTMSN